MKTRKVSQLPGKCQFCKREDQTVIYDAPTGQGTSWGYMCNYCYRGPANGMGTRFELKIKQPTDKGRGKTVKGKCLTSLEAMIGSDELPEIECPVCGEIRVVEPDADYTFKCEGCQANIIINMNMEMFS